MPGWYPEDDPTYTRGVLTKKDQRPIDAAVARLFVKYVEAKGITIVSGKDEIMETVSYSDQKDRGEGA